VKIQATFAGGVLEAAAGGRTIGGVAVPYGVPGHLSTGQTVIFEPGSLDAGARPPSLRDHDPTRPVGRVVDAADLGDRMRATVKASTTRDGDEALALAADGILMFSVGATPIEFDHDAQGVMHVTAAQWDELSILTFGAYAGAQIDTVKAQGAKMNPTLTDDPTVVDPDDDQTTTDPADDDTVDDDDVVTPDQVTTPLQAGRRRPALAVSAPDLSIANISRLLAGAPSQQRAAMQAIRSVDEMQKAALNNVTMVGAINVGSAVRPSFQPELVEIVNWGRPLINHLRAGSLERGDFPNKTFNRWTTPPIVGIQASEKAPIASGTVKIDPVSVPVQTWAGGNDLSQQTLDFGSASFVQDYINAAGVDFAAKSDTYAWSTILALATAATAGPINHFAQNVAAMFGALNPANVPPGGLWLGLSWDVAVQTIGIVGEANTPVYWSGSIDLGSFTSDVSAGGLQTFVDPHAPAGTMLLGMKNAATWYEISGTPFNLKVVDINLLGLDVAVYGYGALGVQYPGAFVKMATTAAVP
jgi:hypothetical protein